MNNMLILIAILASSSLINDINAQAYPCAPAQHCDPRSQLCKPTEVIQAMVRGLPPPKETFETSRGICTDAYKWVCNKDGTKCKQRSYSDTELAQRCKLILFTDRENRDRFKDGEFMQACQQGKFTCEDGSCVDGPGKCPKGLVRYDKSRCAKDECGTGGIVTDVCPFTSNTILIQDNKECIGDTKVTRNACCSRSELKTCEYIQMQKSNTIIPDEQCGTVCIPNINCQTGPPSSITPTSPTTKSPVTPTLPTTKPTAIVPTEYKATGLELQLEFENVNRDCCCRLSCDCFGDPHCTNFYGYQVTSKLSVGNYRMYELGDFSFRAVLGEPQGIISDVLVSTHGSSRKFKLNRFTCTNNTMNWQDADTEKFLKPNELPNTWSTKFSLGDVYADPTTFTVRDSIAQISIIVKCVSFFHLNSQNNPASGVTQSSRLDVQVTKWNDLVSGSAGAKCCPSQAQNIKWFSDRNAIGFCIGNEKLPGAMSQSGGPVIPTGRRLENGEEVIIDLPPLNTVEYLPANETMSQEDGENDDKARLLCEKYLEAVKEAGVAAVAALSDMDKCINNVMDFGLDSLQRLLEALEDEIPTCISDPNHPFLLEPLKDCEQGVVLEVKAPKSNNWVAFRYLASSYEYCSNKLLFDFSRTFLLDGVTPVTSDFEFRLKRCSPDAATCGTCDAISRISDIKFKWVYECIAYNSLKDNARQDLYLAVKNGDITCGLSYIGNTDPLACMKKNFPELKFGSIVIPSGEDVKPTKKPTTKANASQSKQPTLKPTAKPTVEATTKAPNSQTLPPKKCKDVKKQDNCNQFPWCEWTGGRTCESKKG